MPTDNERAILQKRIKNQRRELRRMGRHLRMQQNLIKTLRLQDAVLTSNCYRHAAQMAQSFRYWPWGKRIANYIRQWV